LREGRPRELKAASVSRDCCAAADVHGGFILIIVGFWGCNQRKGREL